MAGVRCTLYCGVVSRPAHFLSRRFPFPPIVIVMIGALRKKLSNANKVGAVRCGADGMLMRGVHIET